MAIESPFIFLLFSLAVWRLAHLLAAEDGPWDLLAKLRESAGDGAIGALLDCFYCTSVWIAAPLAWIGGEDWRQRLLLWPALSAAAILMQRVTEKRPPNPPITYFEDPLDGVREKDDVLLRQ